MAILRLILVAAASGVAVSGVTVAPASPPSVVPFTIQESGGNPRVVVTAEFDGHVMPMMVHSYANFFSQLRHGQASAFGVRLLPGTHKSYGIDRDGHVSDLGLDKGIAPALAVGRSVNRDAPVTIFEVPQTHLGMLGLGWITANRVIVDFPRRQVSVSPDPALAATRAAALGRAGYAALPMTYDDREKHYSVRATIGGVTRRMVIATASAFLIDSAFAAAAHLAHGKDDGHGSGPTGTRTSSYAIVKPVRVTIGRWTSPPIGTGVIQDEYAYSDEKRPADPNAANGGALGGAFLETTGAVIDFGARTLFVKS